MKIMMTMPIMSTKYEANRRTIANVNNGDDGREDIDNCGNGNDGGDECDCVDDGDDDCDG